MSRKSWKLSRIRRRQRKKEQRFSFEDRTVVVTGKGRKFRLAKAAVAMRLSADEAERFIQEHRRTDY